MYYYQYVHKKKFGLLLLKKIFVLCAYLLITAVFILTLIRMTKDEKVLAVFKGLLL